MVVGLPQTRRRTSRTKVTGVYRNMPTSTCSVHGPWAVAAHRSRDDGGLCAIARRFRHELLVHGLSFTRRGVGACRSRGGLHGKGGGGSTRLLARRYHVSDGVVVRRAVTSGPAKVTGGAMTSGIHRTILQKSQGSQGRVPLTGKSGKSVLCALTVGGGEAFPGTLCLSS